MEAWPDLAALRRADWGARGTSEGATRVSSNARAAK